jgi:hypothetical protein
MWAFAQERHSVTGSYTQLLKCGCVSDTGLERVENISTTRTEDYVSRAMFATLERSLTPIVRTWESCDELEIGF